MIAKLRAHLGLTVAFVGASALALVFLVRIILHFAYWEAHQNEPIRPWMTVGYIDRSWGLERGALDAAAHLPAPREGSPLTLREIAEIRDVPVEEVILQVEAALVDLGVRDAVTGAPLDDGTGQPAE